jgi:methylated-DNA-[protein]-cysteine S-methyltransferase
MDPTPNRQSRSFDIELGNVSEAFETPLGTIGLVLTQRGLSRILFLGDSSCTVLTPRRSTQPNLSAAAQEARSQLEAYFRGELKIFSVPLDLEGTPFQRHAWAALLKVEYGQTSTYLEQATVVGNPKACRAVGGANRNNPLPIIVPCHRVVAANGGLGGYSGGVWRKAWLLDLEQRTLS